jgi:methionine-rich copper-binding protein CopC
MKSIRAIWISGLVVLVTAFVLPAYSADAATTDADVWHIVLDNSSPEDESASPGPVDQVRLIFSDAPLMRGASVRVVTSARQLMRTSPPAPDPEDPKQLFVEISPPLPPGAYVVQWRCIADDGHVMRGDFTFEVTAE